MNVTFKWIKAGAMTYGLVLASLSFLSSCRDTGRAPVSSTPASPESSGKIAYVDLDSLEAHYEFFKQKKADFDKRQAAMEAEIERLGQQFQNEYMAFQKKARAGALSQSEGEAAQKRLAQMQQNVETRRQRMGNQLMEEQQKFNEELQSRLDAFLEDYNKDKQYDYILSYAKGGSILFANKSLDITRDVIKGMNEKDKSTATPQQDKPTEKQ